MNVKNNIPNLVTCLNLASGVMACICAATDLEPMWGMTGYQWTFVFIGLAAVFDYCDGLAARTLHAYSALGKELDSLCDCVSFGVAPTLLVYYTMRAGNAMGSGGWMAYFAILIVVCGALRLARYNVDDTQSTSFKGLPIPANAIFWIGTVAWVHDHGYPTNGVMLGLVAVMSWLMICPLRMFSLKIKSLSWRDNFRRYVVLAGCVLFCSFEGVAGLAWTILLYILISVFGRRAVPGNQ